MLKITSLSDTHGNHEKVEFYDIQKQADLVIHGGDFLNVGSQLYSKDLKRSEFGKHDTKKAESFLDWFSNLPNKYKILIGGNHDFFAQNYKQKFLKMIPKNIIYLENESTVIEGYKIFGSPITRDTVGWAFGTKGSEMNSYWEKIPDDTNILITHTPPYDILDLSSRGEHYGCPDLLKRIEQLPKCTHHFFGHVHNSKGLKKLYGKTFINTNVFNGNSPMYFEIDKL